MATLNKKAQVARYLIFDLIAANVGWTLFFIYRKVVIEPEKFGIPIPLEFNSRFYLGLFCISIFWLIIYYIAGQYTKVYHKSRLIELGNTIWTSVIGVVLIFFLLLLDDSIQSYKNYYQLFFTLLGLHFGLTYLFRLILTTRISHQIHHRVLGFDTIIIGGNEKALDIYYDINNQYIPSGNKLVGFLSINENEPQMLANHLPCMGKFTDLPRVIEEQKIEEIIIAIETSEHEVLSEILTMLLNSSVTVWCIPQLFDMLSGLVKTNMIYSNPLIKISNSIMAGWQCKVKRILDVVISLIAGIIFTPVFIVLAVLIRIESRGPVLYRQERIGKFGRPFIIYKLRSMVCNAESDTPKLSSKCDPRITKLGLFLRRTHLDEIPQFYNVFIGEMSLVGPRPERQYFIDQIVQQAPYYRQLHKVRPGITSWGQVKYGYASDVEQMLERLPYDLIYLKNISLYVDFKIMIYTVMTCFKGKGK